MFCPDCGKEVPAGSKFCPGCGKSFGDAPNADSGPAGPQAAGSDAEQNKGMAILAYILFFIPLLAGTHKTSPFVKYHTNQGIVLAIFYIAFSVGTYIVRLVLRAVLVSLLHIWGLWVIIRLILNLIWIVPLVLCILGIINAAKGEMKPLPVIGKFTILK